MALKLYNTLHRQKEEIVPIKQGEISMYNCGPTVYWRAHIGNIRAYVGWDVLHRFLLYKGIKVKRYVNFTDVGHMSSDEDFGEDKIEQTAKLENKDPYDIAAYYIGTILKDFGKMNILSPNGQPMPQMDEAQIKATTKEEWAKLGWLRATDHIEEMISIVKKIEANGYTYETDQAIYFDVTKFDRYTELSRQKLSDKLEGVRDEVNVDPQKKHPADFVLWMKAAGHYENHMMIWESPWGKGFPGWHIECTAMGTKYLGDEFDIHTGGVDHIPVHHPNEIAQNFGAFQKDVVHYWAHNDMLISKEGDKLSKSKKNALQFDEVLALGYDPMDLRYYFLTVNYRMPLPFGVEGLDGARNARKRLLNDIKTYLSVIVRDLEGYKRDETVELVSEKDTQVAWDEVEKKGKVIVKFKEQFVNAMDNNLNTSVALSLLYSLIMSSGTKAVDILATICDFDRVLGLKLGRESGVVVHSRISETTDAVLSLVLPSAVRELYDARQTARNSNDYAKSDTLRDKLKELGYGVKDSKNPDGTNRQEIFVL